MGETIVNSTYGVTLAGAGSFFPSLLNMALIHAPSIVAADGGVEHVVSLGHEPLATIGDLDSVTTATLQKLPPNRVHRIYDDETTDFDKCLSSIKAPLILAVGFTGARLDHELGAFWTLADHSSQICILIGPEDIAFIAPKELALTLEIGTRVSLFALGEVKGDAKGLRWPITELDFRPGSGRLGISNETSAPEVEFHFSARKMLVFLPNSCLDTVISALAPELNRPKRVD